MNNILFTRSICPICKKEISAQIELTEKVIMKKKCEEHGSFEGLVEKRSDIYLRLKYASQRNCNLSKQVFLEVTNECNLSCDYCYHQGIKGEITKEEILKAIDEIPYSEIIITGGEPTVREDLFDLIAYIRQKGKFPILNTNGIKLKDRNYVEELKRLGCGITLTFFDKQSIQAMDNMLSLGMYHSNVCSISVKSLEEIDYFINIAYQYKLLWAQIRLRGIISKPFIETKIFLSDLWTYFIGRYNIFDIDNTNFNNIYYVNLNFKGVPLRLICWANIMNVDTTELNIPPYHYPTNENMVLAMLKKWKENE